MTPLRPALVSRLYKAIYDAKQTDAELLLAQRFSTDGSDPPMECFVKQIRRLGTDLLQAGQIGLAEEHLSLALALYDSFAAHAHHEGLACARTLSELYAQTKQEKQLTTVLDHAYLVIQRLARRLDGYERIYKQGSIANSIAGSRTTQG